MGMLASDVRRDGSLTAAWDGASPATEPLNTCVTVNQPANGCVTFQLTGTWVGTITFEVSLDGTFVAVPATKLGASPAQATTATTTGIYVVHAPGTVYIRARCSAFTSGTITVIGIGSVTEFIPSAAGLAAAGASTVSGGLTNNNAAPGATNVGVLPAVANAVVPTWTEGRQVLLSTDLLGFQRGIVQGISASGATAVGVNPLVGGMNGAGALIRFLTEANAAVATAGNGILGVSAMPIAVAHGANPTAVTAAQYATWKSNVAGIPFVIGGHPNVQTFAQNYTSAQTNAAVITVAAGTKIVVTGFMITAANSNTVDVSARLGFGTANTPAYGAAQLLGTHPGIAPGSGFGRGGGAGIIGAGADDEDLRITLSVPTGGSCDAMVSYYTVPV